MSARPASAQTVAEYLAAIPEAQRADARRLHRIIRKTAPMLKPFLRSGMIGYGPLHVRYGSGREVDRFGSPMPEMRKDRFPKGDVGMSCVRFRKLTDLDADAVVALVRAAVRARKTWATE